jgi:Domain of unknown function (DUF4340)
MKTKSTAIWFALAVLLFAFIWLWQKHWQPGQPTVPLLLSGLRAADVTGVEVIPAGALAIDADCTNGVWQLEKPYVYPAQAAAIENLIAVLEKLTPATRLTAAEIGARKDAGAEYGFDNPQFSLVISAGDQQWRLLIGNKTAPGDQVFVRIAGVAGAFVTDANWLQLLPRNAVAWRDTSLVDTADTFDWIVITNGAKVIELRRDTTNQFWRMTQPLAARANNELIIAALEQLRSGQVARFVTDDPKADLTTFGLQPASLDLWLGSGTNLTAGIHLGKSTPENPAQVYARREGWNSVVAVTNELFSQWRGTVNDFRDPRLLELTTPVAQLDVRGGDNFTLQQRGSNDWTIVGEKFPVDTGTVNEFIRLLGGLRVAEFVKEYNTPTDLQGFGLVSPAGTNQIKLQSVAGDTNSVIAQIIFGTVETNKVYVKRADENYVYALRRNDLSQIQTYEKSWFFRDRNIWNFSETNVAQITLRQNGKTRTLLRNGVNLWSIAAGSQGTITPPAVEESVHRLGDLTALGWLGIVGRGLSPVEGGFNTNNLQIAVELKTGEKLSVDFGTELPRDNTALAAVTLDGERWVFVFPPVTYQFVSTYLTIPPDAP